MKMSVTPDGVRVEVETQDKDGKADKKVYEAEDMESFKAKYPEVAKRFGIGGFSLGGFSLGGPDVRIFRNLPDQDFGRRIREQMQEHQRRQRELMEQLRGWKLHGQDLGGFGDPRVGRLFSWRDEAPAVSPAGERLGVYAVDAPAAVSEFLGLEAGQGLQVEEVIDGSLADTLGIQKGDIVFRIGDRKIFAVEDVRKALRSIQAGDTVVVQVNRRGKVLGLGAKKPASPQPEKTQPKKIQPKKLKQRGKVR